MRLVFALLDVVSGVLAAVVSAVSGMVFGVVMGLVEDECGSGNWGGGLAIGGIDVL